MNIRKDDEIFKAYPRTWGRSLGIVIPYRTCRRLGIKAGDEVIFVIPKRD